MTLPVLRDDALRSTDDGFELLLSLPWIRSLPLESLRDVSLAIDGDVVEVSLPKRDGWWYIQDRIGIRGARPLTEGPHDVTVSFSLAVPYLQAGPTGPLTLPFRASRALIPDADHRPAPVQTSPRTEPFASPDRGWELTASAFNWTPDVIRADRATGDIATEIVASGLARSIEIEAGQTWRSFPVPDEDEVARFRTQLESVGGSVSIVGASLDDWHLDGSRRTEDERWDFLQPQVRAAAAVGALGVRLPIGQAGPALLRRALPTLHELGVTLFEEAQGHQTPTASSSAFDDIAALDDPHVRVLIDISMLMPALPVTYLERLRSGGVADDLVDLLATDWQNSATHGHVVDFLRSGRVPGPVHTMYMNLLVRFGRSNAADLRDVLPLVGGIHLKFWDLDDADGRISAPISDVGTELRAAGFSGTLCSEWGGNEWLDDDAADMTRRHLALASSALSPVTVRR